ncbi:MULTISPECIES: ATP-binding cassette domain-containing protein [Inquilinus]|uniref:ABC-2 type transport system ATP-binding protein n=1 Tax=Inquilinus ginsengisoli TaxID=363840 RepID=A0ABU1JHS0_9PROT|nr:ATP-binding cassette domain-containing protein [Inquilinus ginsengisoli]MDR6288160.1 ABC-2 type transport system ATP-binding protein [Inquilinus ginsengisoli]
MNDTPVITLDAVVKRFSRGRNAVVALDQVSARIPDRRLTGLVGPDGAGKTTLMRLVAGLIRLDGGQITVLGRDGVRQAAENQAEIGYMPQRFGLYEDLTVDENLRLYADLHRLSAEVREGRVQELLRFTDLARFGSRLAGQLSGGMKQKLGLACCLLSRPRLLLLDEPSVGVDPVSRRELWQIVRRLVDDGVPVLWSTAYLDEAERCDEVLLLDGGHLVGAGTPESFTASIVGRSFLIKAEATGRRALQRRLLRAPGVLDAVIQGGNVRLLLAPEAILPDGIAAAPVAPRFEDAFVTVLRQRDRGPMPAAEAPAEALAADAEPAIVTSGLVRRFGNFRAVDNVSFAVARGEIFGLLGPNGAGKSTIFRILCGLLAASEGVAKVAGMDLSRGRAEARGRLGYMAQRFSLYGDLTVRQNLEFFGGAYGLSGVRLAAAIDRSLSGFDLAAAANDRPSELPLGFKQRLALAAALIHDPQILFLDEPTSGVDPLTRREFWSRIGGLADQGVTVLVTSHFMEEAEYCDRLAVIYRGRIAALGSPDAIKAANATVEQPDPTLEEAFIRLITAQDQAVAA